MPKLNEKYASKDEALKEFEALLVEEDDGVTLHQDVIRQFTAVNDMKSNLSKARSEERAAKAKMKELESAIDGRDINDLEAALDELEELRSRKDSFASGDDKQKIDEIVSRRVEAATKKHQRELARIASERDEFKTSFEKSNGRLTDLTLEQQIAKMAKAKGIQDSSLKLVMRYAKQDFQLDENGDIVARDDSGTELDKYFTTLIDENPALTINLKDAGSDITKLGGSVGTRSVKRSDFDELSKTDPAKARELVSSVREGKAQLVDG